MKLNSKEREIFFTSDTHAYHKNITSGVTSWDNTQRCREFDDEVQMTEQLVKNINDIVPENGILFHLGDWSFGGIDKIWKFREQIRCRTIHLIYGNHDHHIINNRTFKDFTKRKYTKDAILSVNVKAQELFESCRHYREIFIDKEHVILCHFAMRVWNKSHHGSIMLYGHSHGTLPEYGGENSLITGNHLGAKTMDVGVDTNDLKPYRWEEIKEIMDTKAKLIVDHHNENTN